MLYLNPPYDIIRGVSVFRDHDPASNQFYYLPIMPHLTVINGEPSFSLIKFTGEAGSGGFLNFDVNLGIDQEVQDEIRTTLRAKYDLDETPNLIPVLVEDGSVRLMILGKESPEPTPPAGQFPVPPPPEPEDFPEFVLKIDHFAKPSLYGDNQAIFSVQLDQYGVAIIEESLKGVLQPIGIVYALTFLALRPAYNIKVTADWDRVQKHLEESFSASVLFLSTEVSKVVDKLIEDQVIKIEVDNFVPEGEEAASLITDPKKAVSEVKEMIMHTFFQPSINPVSTEKDGWDKFTDTALALNNLAVTGGWAGVATLSYKNIDMTRVDRRSFNFNMTERTTVRRSIYPQAHLQGLTRILRSDGGTINLEDYVHAVNIDDPFFQRRKVNVTNRADLAEDSITSINVSLNYGNEPKNVILDTATTKASVDWASILQGNQMVRDLTYHYKVTFKSVDTADRPGVLESLEANYTNDELEINPRSDGLYSIINVPITTLNFPFDLYPNIEVQLRYNDPDNQISLNDTFMLSKEKSEARWPFFLRNPEKESFEYKIIFRAADNHDIAWDWKTTDQQQIILRDPRPNKRTVTIVPAVNWNQVAMIFADLSYRDDDNGVLAEQSYMFSNSATGTAPQTFSVPLVDIDKRLVSYKVKFLLTDNSEVDLPSSQTLANQIILRADLKGHRVITVKPEEVDFANRKVDRIHVDLLYKDEDNGLSFESSFSFRSNTEKGFFEFDYVNSQENSYTAQITTIFRDGFAFARDPQSNTQDVLVLPVGKP